MTDESKQKQAIVIDDIESFDYDENENPRYAKISGKTAAIISLAYMMNSLMPANFEDCRPMTNLNRRKYAGRTQTIYNGGGTYHKPVEPKRNEPCTLWFGEEV